VVKLIVAALLAAAGLYLAIRLLELDRINQETPDQDDPLFGDEDEHGAAPETRGP